MEFWFIAAIISALFMGVYEFLQKVAAEKEFNRNRYLFYMSIIQIVVSFIFFVYSGAYFYMGFLFGFLVIVRKILVVEKDVYKMKSLKYIDSSLFFPVNKFMRIGGGFIVGMFLFNEFLSQGEYIFLVGGMFSIFLLGYKKGSVKQNNFKKGIIYMVLSGIFLIGTSTINKYVSLHYDPAFYIFIGNIIGIVYISAKIKFSRDIFVFKKEEMIYGLISGVLGFGGLLSLLLALKGGKLVIVQLITTMMIIIPIILSFIVYKEKIGKLRLIGLLLFIANFGIFYLNK